MEKCGILSLLGGCRSPDFEDGRRSKVEGHLSINLNLMHLKTLIFTCLILLSYHSFSQTDNKLKSRDHRFSIEPYFIPGYLNTGSDIDKWRFHAIPGLNLGMNISKRSSVSVGANYSQLNGITYYIACIGYPCPNTRDYKFINISLGFIYDAYDRNNFSIEPFINIYEEITIYLLRYYYYNKENEQWLSDETPYLGPYGVSIGAYLNYRISDHVGVFAAPSFSYLFAWRYSYLIGSSFGTTLTF